jgi:hypothetical protein
MSGWQDIARAFVVGVVAIGMATALLSPGRQTTQVVGAVFSGSNSLLHTAESG